MNPASWVITRKSDNRIMFETWNYKVANAINTEKYNVYGIAEWLAMQSK